MWFSFSDAKNDFLHSIWLMLNIEWCVYVFAI